MMNTTYRTLSVILLMISLLVGGTGCSSVMGIFKSGDDSKKTTTNQQSTPPQTQEQKAPDVAQLIETGIAQQQAGELNKAIATFERARELDPNNAQALTHLQEAQEERQRLITMHLNAGIKYFNQDALEDAIKEWDEVLALDPNHQEALEYKAEAQARLDALSN